MKIRLCIGIGSLLLLLFCSFTTLQAVESQFEINATVIAVADTTPPSVPTALTATAVSTSQIDLSWTASTDNVAVTGYRIYRDNAFVTTSAVTTYSDTGLTSATTYAYTVSAIDAALNESARSATSSATTFTPSSTTGGGGGSGQVTLPVIYNVQVVPSTTGAVISWETTQASQSSLSWGLTSDNELGTSAGTVYTTVHEATITGLLAGTTYFFSIDAVNGYGAYGTLKNQRFTTLMLPEGNINPTNFTATARVKDILLSWNNPNHPDFEEVRLVRSRNFFPSDPNDGEVIYEGRNEEMVDVDVVLGITYYYALFAKDKNGTFSSGSLAKARIPLPGEPQAPPSDIFDDLPPALTVHPQIQALTLLDFDFIQDGRKITTILEGQQVPIDGNKNLTVSLDYRKVPEVLKSIVITLTYPADKEKTFSFLLRVNAEKTVYSATIAPLGESGLYGINISIVDYKNQGLKKIVGSLLATVAKGFEAERNAFWRIVKEINENKVSLVILLIAFAIFFKAMKTVLAKKKEQKSSTHSNA